MLTALGFFLICLAGMSDGSFYLPSKFTKQWEWEHCWATFSLGFFVISWLITLMLIPNVFEIYRSVPVHEIAWLCLFGLLWGVGSVLFGTAMKMLGMALGYPVGLGTVACVGALIPLVTTRAEHLFTIGGAFVVIGVIVTVFGINVCAGAYRLRENHSDQSRRRGAMALAAGLTVAVLAGVFSAQLNVGFSFGENVIRAARASGAGEILSGAVLWSIFFTPAFAVNFGYSLLLMIKRKTFGAFWGPHLRRNLPLGTAMGALFVCAIYVYSIGATCLGDWGEVPGWVIFMSVDTVVGNLWGLYTGEWDGASVAARRVLRLGTAVIVLAIVIVAIGQYCDTLGEYAAGFNQTLVENVQRIP